MSSSPKLAEVEAFEYQDPGGPGAGGPGLPGASRVTAHNGSGGRDAAEELELKLAAARAEGIREGLQQAQQSVENERAKVAEAVRLFSQKTTDYYSRVEIELVHLSLAIAAKILHREAQVDRLVVAALVKVALEKLQQGTTATVRVRPEEVADWNRYFEGNGGGEIRVEVKPDPLVEAHNCILETDLGTTQLGLDAQLKEIEQGFFDLLAQRPDSK
ncbi:MAG TPA: FliH/SctL family protein [Terriglobales bacterium]|nr:FliH/SctL family protein [Terriglobales bacterium]